MFIIIKIIKFEYFYYSIFVIIVRQTVTLTWDSGGEAMLDTLITSKTRIKLLLKFFLNSNASSYLRNLEGEFGESTNGIRLELNKFEKAGLLSSRISGNKKLYSANTAHPLFNDIHNILLK